MPEQCLLIIISYNQLDYTRQCVASIQKHTEYPYHLLIIDNCSNQETRDYLCGLQRQKNVDIIFNQVNQGWIGGVNQGLNYGVYEYYCVMNNDIEVYPCWLSEMVAIAQKDKKIGLVNPQWESPKKYKEDYAKFLNEVISQQKGEYAQTDWMRGFCFLVKRGVVEAIGGLDTIYGSGYYDDWDYSVRAVEAGYRCVRAKGAFVYHCKNVTFTSLMRKFEYDENFNRNKALFYNRWGRPLKILLVYTKELQHKHNDICYLASEVLKAQDSLFILTTSQEIVIEHTNCIQKNISEFLLSWNIRVRLLDNFRHSVRKRYNVILCSDFIKQAIQHVPVLGQKYPILAVDTESKEKLLNKIKGLKQYK
ncbi:hypothetical protein MNBD_UNCLBAC01-1846 [hydrothermal vent metagenome]|uniref:Glycosyltransferase 2-like domain-containing protein n=1 Tax=hydrothermal vent metagenome TaxID=652676 RepID=A0A3B1DJK6_9ZZZZ